MTGVYLLFEATGELHVANTSGPVLHAYKELCKQHGEGGVMYWHNGSEWMQWHPDTMRMHLDESELPKVVRALHLVGA